MSDVISIFGTHRPADPFAGKGYGVADFPVATRPMLYFNDDTDQWYESMLLLFAQILWTSLVFMAKTTSPLHLVNY